METLAITWSANDRRGTTPAGHRIFVLHNPHTKTRVVQVIYPPGGSITERVVACEDDAIAQQEAVRLVELPYHGN